MTVPQQQEIQWKLNNYASSFPSQKQAFNTLKGCSEATLINMCKGNWNGISDEMWRNVAAQLQKKSNNVPVVDTQNFNTLILYFTVAKENGATFAVVGGAGYGKSFAGKFFSQNMRDKNVYYLECAEYWNKKELLGNILLQMGKAHTGMNIPEMMRAIVSELRRQHQPLIIWDEVDKLSDALLKFFITLYNELNSICGQVWTSTNNIEKRMTRGISRNTTGYQELFSRIGQRFITLHPAASHEIAEICEANGITDKEEVATIINECNGDLRRVERNFLKKKAKETRKHLKAA